MAGGASSRTLGLAPAAGTGESGGVPGVVGGGLGGLGGPSGTGVGRSAAVPGGSAAWTARGSPG